MMRAPPSTITLWMPKAPNRSSKAVRLTCPRAFMGNRRIRAPAASSTCWRSTSAGSPAAIQGDRMLTQQVRAQWERSRLSATIGWGFLPSTRRTVRRGLSARTVPIPQDSVVRRPQLVRQGHGERTAQRQWLTRPGRNGTIHALRIT